MNSLGLQFYWTQIFYVNSLRKDTSLSSNFFKSIKSYADWNTKINRITDNPKNNKKLIYVIIFQVKKINKIKLMMMFR